MTDQQFQILNVAGTWLAGLATVAAVLVALAPIWREASRRNAQARSLRIRISSKLTILRPSLGAIIQGETYGSVAVFTKEEYRQTIEIISAAMRESAVLEVEEQDQLGTLLANLEISAVLYGSSSFEPASAENILQLLDRSLVIMGEYGLVKANVIKPWE